ncbi:hypothetical protein TNIN_376781 [Trichonephila inaurata madagascariensis]|uniref:Uncharacterized protein n=1 Tax=Trichonephila inaurata madagascariensis TaxID=2747483 RepID=A0A8X6XH54_9ARAC|nr:hypothetical protein TNIN_376781 [Trichonephila inaurata madagascariensis]
MCLFEFAVEPFYAKKVRDCEESIDAEKEVQPTRQRPINLANIIKMVIRNVPAVVRAHAFNLLENPEEIVEAEIEDAGNDKYAVSLDGLRIVELDC